MLFCINCGQQLPEEAKFCSKCGTAINNANKNNQRITVYDGIIHKCPNCGETLNSFSPNCTACGYELRGTKSSNVIREFSAKLQAIENLRPHKNPGIFKSLNKITGINATDEMKISLIKSFTIPNNKEDILEFLILASSNINVHRYNDFEQISESEKAVSDAWKVKFEQAYEKAKLSFGYTTEFKKIQEIYNKKSKEIKDSKKKQVYWWICFATFFIIFSIVEFGIAFFWINSNNKKVEKENERLEVIVTEVYEALENENYTLARAKTASLTFSGPQSADTDIAIEKWNKTRTELLSIIDAAEKGLPVDLQDIEKTTSKVD